MDQETQDQLDAIQKRLKNLEDNVSQPTHYHNGFDSNQISYLDLYQKKIYVRHTLPGATAAVVGNYGSFFIAPVACLVTKIQEVHEVLGTDGGAVTLNLEKLVSGVAPGAGATLLTTALSLKATINVVQTGSITITSSSKTVAAGDRIGLVLTGTPTSVAGMTVHVELQF